MQVREKHFPRKLPNHPAPYMYGKSLTLHLEAFVICCPLVVREISFHLSTTMWLEDQLSGFPGSQSGWESTCQCRTHRFHPWSRKIPPAEKQLNPCTTTTEPSWHNHWITCTPEPTVHGNEKPCIMTKSSPHSLQLEKTLTQQQRASAAKNKNIRSKYKMTDTVQFLLYIWQFTVF